METICCGMLIGLFPRQSCLRNVGATGGDTILGLLREVRERRVRVGVSRKAKGIDAARI